MDRLPAYAFTPTTNKPTNKSPKNVSVTRMDGQAASAALYFYPNTLLPRSVGRSIVLPMKRLEMERHRCDTVKPVTIGSVYTSQLSAAAADDSGKSAAGMARKLLRQGRKERGLTTTGRQENTASQQVRTRPYISALRGQIGPSVLLGVD